MAKLQKFTAEYQIMGLVRDLKSGKINRDAEMQRSYVWGNKEQTEYLDSVFQSANTYIPPIIGAQSEIEMEIKGKMELVIDLLDGKQRSTTIEKFVNNEIKLGNNIKPVVIEQEDETEKEYIIAGMKWEELPEEVKNLFKANKIQMIFFKGMSYEDRERQFIKLNGGKKLSNAELNKTRIGQNMREFIYKQLASDLWTKYINISNNRETKFEAMQQATMVLCGELELGGKALQDFAENNNITTEALEQIESITEYLSIVTKSIKRSFLPAELRNLEESEITEKLEDKNLKKYLKPIDFMKKVNVPIIYNTALQAIQNNIMEVKFAEFLTKFFDKIPFDYTRYNGTSTADMANVKGRINVLEKAFEDYFKIEKIDQDSEIEEGINNIKSIIDNVAK